MVVTPEKIQQKFDQLNENDKISIITNLKGLKDKSEDTNNTFHQHICQTLQIKPTEFLIENKTYSYYYDIFSSSMKADLNNIDNNDPSDELDTKLNEMLNNTTNQYWTAEDYGYGFMKVLQQENLKEKHVILIEKINKAFISGYEKKADLENLTYHKLLQKCIEFNKEKYQVICKIFSGDKGVSPDDIETVGKLANWQSLLKYSIFNKEQFGKHKFFENENLFNENESGVFENTNLFDKNESKMFENENLFNENESGVFENTNLFNDKSFEANDEADDEDDDEHVNNIPKIRNDTALKPTNKIDKLVDTWKNKDIKSLSAIIELNNIVYDLNNQNHDEAAELLKDLHIKTNLVESNLIQKIFVHGGIVLVGIILGVITAKLLSKSEPFISTEGDVQKVIKPSFEKEESL